MLCLFIRVPAVLPELIDLGGEFIDPLHALALVGTALTLSL
jgi:hypothetical protein